MNEETLHGKLERYVRGQLSQEESAALERDMAQDPDLQEQLRLHRLELESHEYLLRQRLRENVYNWILETPPYTPRPSFLGKNKSYLILAGLSLAAVGFWYWNQSVEQATQPIPKILEEKAIPTPPSEMPIAQEQTPMPPTAPRPERRNLALVKRTYQVPQNFQKGTVRSEDPNVPPATDPMSIGIRAYHDGQYKAAIRAFEQIKPQSDPAQYALSQEWQAHTWFQIGLQDGNLKPAAKLFQSIADQKSDDLAQDRAEWYLLLCLVSDYPEQQKRGEALMRDIIGKEFHRYREAAEQLKKNLR